MRLRPGALAAAPRSGPDPWIVTLWLRRPHPGGLLLPDRGELLMELRLTADQVAQLGGPEQIRNAIEPDRRRFAKGAIARGYGPPWAVELDIERTPVRSVFVLPSPVAEVVQ